MTAPTTAELALRHRQIGAHVLAVIRLSIEAHMHELAGHPVAARDASLDAAANCRCIWVLAGVTGRVSG
jgi:hypothetical protein